jgi:hypothetical protein
MTTGMVQFLHTQPIRWKIKREKVLWELSKHIFISSFRGEAERKAAQK